MQQKIIKLLKIKITNKIGENAYNTYFLEDLKQNYLETRFSNKDSLNVRIELTDKDATLSYSATHYNNYSEYPFKVGKSEASITQYLFSVIEALLFEGATRRDTYVGGKLTSSNLIVGDADKTKSVKRLSLFGKRTYQEFIYPPLIKK